MVEWRKLPAFEATLNCLKLGTLRTSGTLTDAEVVDRTISEGDEVTIYFLH